MNRPLPEEDADIPEAADDPVVPEKEEVIKAVKSLKNEKAPGHNNLNPELFKADPELAATILHPLFVAI